MPHLPYVDPDNVADPEIRGYLSARTRKARRGRRAKRFAPTIPMSFARSRRRGTSRSATA
jgi:hypothetical protein